MQKNLCPACGQIINGGIGLGGTILCRQCEPAISAEISALRQSGKPVNVGHIAHRLYKEAHSGGNYLLRDVPAELLLAVKHRAVDESCSMRDLIIKALWAYI